MGRAVVLWPDAIPWLPGWLRLTETALFRVSLSLSVWPGAYAPVCPVASLSMFSPAPGASAALGSFPVCGCKITTFFRPTQAFLCCRAYFFIFL